MDESREAAQKKQARLKNWLIPAGILLAALILLAVSLLIPKPVSDENMVIITVGQKEYARIPLSQPQTVTVTQENGEINVVEITRNGARMVSSTCKNQLCVQSGEVTVDNWELRPNQEYIICLPNQVSIQLVVKE